MNEKKIGDRLNNNKQTFEIKASALRVAQEINFDDYANDLIGHSVYESKDEITWDIINNQSFETKKIGKGYKYIYTFNTYEQLILFYTQLSINLYYAEEQQNRADYDQPEYCCPKSLYIYICDKMEELNSIKEIMIGEELTQ